MYRLSQNSLNKLEGVDARLRALAELAIQITPVDFGISQGLRTVEQQREMVQRGASKTMNSKHITGQAIDVFAYVDGAARWEMCYYIDIAEAFRKAAETQQVVIRWGGAWNVQDLRKMAAQTAHNYYIRERTKAGLKPFIDGPHFELN